MFKASVAHMSEVCIPMQYKCYIYFFLFAASFGKLGLTPHLIMAHLPAAEIQARREAAMKDILEEWQGNSEVAILCPCRIACNCMAVTEVERVILSFCLYPGELDYFYTQPFNATHGFKVRWHCDQCQEEMACGFPPLGVGLLH